MNISELSVKRPVAVIMAVMIFFVIGLYSLSMLSMEMMPDMSMPIAAVITQYDNVAPDEVENLITRPVEGAVGAVSGLKNVQSSSTEGSSMIVMEFTNGTDMDKATQEIREKIDLIKSALPDESKDPMILKYDTSMMPVAMFSISADGYDLIQTKKLVEDELQSRLEAIDGVASVSVSGAQDREIQVVVDPERLFGYDISVNQLISAIANQNQNMPTGSTHGMGKSMPVRVMGKFNNVYDIDRVPLTTTNGQVIYLSDVAEVDDTYTKVNSYARLNGEDSLSVSITKQSDANTVEVVNAVISTLDSIVDSNSRISYNMTMEQASYIENAISSVAQNAIMGAVLAIIVLFLFLGSIRSSLVIGISMPVSVITTFIGMYFSGMTLNVVSLGGLSLGVGMLVDNSVVVLENIYRRRKSLGESAKTAGIKGASEVFGAVVASVLTTCIVYVPILFIDNIMAVMFKQLAFTIIFSQTASLLVTFLLVPMLSSRITNIENDQGKMGFLLKPFEKGLAGLYVIYEKILRTVLRHRKIFIFCVIGTFVLSMVVLGNLGMTLMPSSDEGSLTVSVSLPEGSELEDTNAVTLEAENIIAQNPMVKTIFSNAGGGDSMFGTSSNSSSITVTLVDKKERKKKTTSDVVEELRVALGSIAGAEIQIASSDNTMMSSSDSIQFTLSGSETDKLEEFAVQVQDALAGISGVREVTSSIADTKPEIRVRMNPGKASKYGLNTATASSLIKSALSGQVAAQYSENGKEYDIRVKYPEDYAKNYTQLKSLRIKSTTGQWINLDDIADVTIEQGYTSLARINQKRTVTVSAQIYGTDIGTATTEFNRQLDQMVIPEGCKVEAGGSYETMMDAMLSLLVAILLGILLMYMIMAAQFENLVQPLIIIAAVPMALIGVVAALAVSRSPLSVVGCIGILMLGGIVVNNAIILIDFINTAKKEKEYAKREDLLVDAGKTRMRPVLMTTLTSVLGFLPMALSTAEGSEMMRPLAVVLLGGLCMGTVLTLVMIPVLYSVVDDRKVKRKQKKQRRLEKKAERAQKKDSNAINL